MFWCVPEEDTDALNIKPGGKCGETVKAALQIQSDKTRLQLHITGLSTSCHTDTDSNKNTDFY